LRRPEGVPAGRQAPAVAVVAVVAAAAAAAAVDMVVVVEAAVAADIWVEVARAQDWAVAVRRTVRAARLWRLMATHWGTTAPTRAPCMPPTRWPANMPQPNTNRRHPSLPAQIIIITTSLIAASPSLAKPIRDMLVSAANCWASPFFGPIVTLPLSPQRGTLRIL
jgi:hypothetical protein